MELFSIFGRILLKDDGVENKLSNITDKARMTEGNFSNSFEKMKNGALRLGATLVTGLGINLLIKKTYELADSASDLSEAQNVVEQTYKKSSKAIEKWTNTTAKSAGISKTASTQWVGFMGAMLKSGGVTEKKAGAMSKSLVQLTGDMSSFYNVGTSDMWEKIRSGISGETEPLKQLGINMSVANLEAYALATGIKKPYKEMSQSEQTILRYNYLMKVTKDAQGDFGRTLDTSFANQVRVAKLNMETLGQTIGKVFLPPYMKAVKLFNENAPAIQSFLENLTQNGSKIGPMIGTFAAVTASLFPILTGMNKLKDASNLVTNTFSNFTSKFGIMGSKITEYMGSAKKIPTIFRTANNDTKIALGLLQNNIGQKLSPLGGLINTKLKPITGILNKLPAGLQVAFGKAGTGIIGFFGKVVPKLGAGFTAVGSKMASGLKMLVSLGLKAVAPAAIIATILLGLGLLETTMGTKLDTIAKKLIDKGPQMIQQFATNLIAQIPILIDAGTKLLNNFINVLTANAPALISAAVAIITALVNGLTTNIPKLMPTILQLIQTILTAIINNLPKIIMAGLKIILALVQGISNNINKIITIIVTVVTQIIKVLAQNAPALISAGIQILVALIQGISKAIPQLVAALPIIVKAIWDGLKSVNWGELGGAILDGILAGLKAAASGIWETIKAVGGAIKEGFKSFFGIHSPSRLMRDEIGKNLSLGIAEGIKDVDFMQEVSNTIENNFDKPKEAVKKVANKIKTELDAHSRAMASIGKFTIAGLSEGIKNNVSLLNKAIAKIANKIEESNIKDKLSVLFGRPLLAISSDMDRLGIDTGSLNKNLKNQELILEDAKDKVTILTAKWNQMGYQFGYSSAECLDARKELEDAITSVAKLGREVEETKEKIKKANEENNKNIISNLNNMFGKIKDALKEHYSEEQKIVEKNINKQIEANNKWKDNSLKNIETVYNSKIKALDNELEAHNIAKQDEEDNEKETELRKIISMNYSKEKKAEAQKELDDLLKEREERKYKEGIETKKANLKTEYEADKENVENIAKRNDEYYKNQLDDIKFFYEKKLREANIDAEAQKMIIDNNQKDIISLLKNYGKDYEIAGASLGERLANAFKGKMQGLASFMDNIVNKVNSITTSVTDTVAIAGVPSLASVGAYSSSSNVDNSQTTVNKYGSLLHAENVNINGYKDTESFAQELEFYREQAAKSKGGK